MWYWVFRAIFIVILKLFYKFKVEGLENFPQKTNFIIVANHASYLDTLVIGSAVPKRVYWIAHWDLYNIFWLRWFFNLIQAFSSNTSTSDKALNLLKQNKNVGLFPEGELSYDGSLGEFRRGVALLALKTGRPIVPCAILGTYEALPRQAKFPKLFVPIKIKIGKCKYLWREFEDTVDELYLQEGIFKIRSTIKEMLDAG